MKYAKCIRASQIAISAADFLYRQDEEYHVYCKGQTTKAKNGVDTLCCVPLNYIYDCLRYGQYIALIDIKDEPSDYPIERSYLNWQQAASEQRVIDIFHSYKKETIDFIFREVGNPTLVRGGYVPDLPEAMQKYFNAKKGVE